eukprot:CAMPEP_0117754210 /NCGR_PEP_ID=MMETSP0947-20121206/12695_1 /TAXON_ID=44440 /ORGANISM="Chattonella subsalsa, Strain CCMP2191" /LENGTH=763 /DNA_ID=CAMNT_0005573259 /DNA_START=72 /DNA_END=2363 /DNA_ORIENTATION=+
MHLVQKMEQSGIPRTVEFDDFEDAEDAVLDLENCKVSLISAQKPSDPDMVTEVGDVETESERGSACSESSDPDYISATRRVFKQLELDPENAEWKAARNRLLLEGILELENPIVTDKMIDFLLQDGVCEILISYIIQLAPEGESAEAGRVERLGRDSPSVAVSESQNSAPLEVKRSFRAMMLLSRDDPTDALLTFLGKKAPTITQNVFMLFGPNSKGVLQHGCRLIDHLLKHHTNEVFETISDSLKSVESSLGLMLHHLDNSIVADCFVKIITQPSLQQPSHYKVLPQKKWKLFQALSEWRLLIKLAKHITEPEYSFAHVSNTADVMLQIVEKLAADSNGEILLQPIGHCPELVSSLVDLVADRSKEQRRRTEAGRVLQGLTKKAVEEQIVCTNIWQLAFGASVQPTIPNQLQSVKDLFFSQMSDHFSALAKTVVEEQSALSEGSGSETEKILHPGFVVEKPFTLIRFLLTEILAEVAAQDPEKLNELSMEFWRCCCQWLVKYPHNDLYHAIFHRLAFHALRSNQEEALKLLMQKCRFVTQLVSICTDPTMQTVHGAATKLANLMRLQAETLPPSSFLRGFLASHQPWKDFLPKLRELTIKQQQYGLGFSVPQCTMPGQLPGSLASQPLDQTGIEGGIDLGSRFAQSLGFEDHDIPWPIAGSSLTKSRKRKKKKKSNKGKKSHGGGDEGVESKGSSLEKYDTLTEGMNGDDSADVDLNPEKIALEIGNPPEITADSTINEEEAESSKNKDSDDDGAFEIIDKF